MLSGRILYAVHDGTYVIKFAGDVRVPLCASLEGFLDRMFSDPALQAVLIDLTDTVAIDSTALGLIAKIAIFLKQRVQKKPVILSTNPDVNRILASMGFDRVFLILEKAPAAEGSLDELPVSEPSQQELTRHVIEAHRVLMGLNEKNKATFRDLVAALECEEKDQH
ncbi:MAG TPA: STAS domain-containing protein [Moraxellaceae bacterium]|nr:STAS domain-containing protein [Moraxellaceae bacterium]